MNHSSWTVYDCIKRHPRVSNQELASILGWSINRITPRTKELRDAGLIVHVGWGQTIFGNRTHLYSVKEEGQ